jgi:uncharacterized membrane protein YczE
MEKRKVNFSISNLLLYALGVISLGLAINLMKSSNLGSGAWDTVSINIRDYINIILGIEWITIGMVSIVITTIIMLVVLLYRKQAVLLFMIVPIISIGSVIDFWNIVVFNDYYATSMIVRVLFYVSGTLIIPLSLSLMIKSSFPASVFDEFMLMLIDIFKTKRIALVRFAIEFLGLAIGTVFGYLTYASSGHLGAVNFGSLIVTFALGPIMAFYLRVLGVTKSDTTLKEDFLLNMKLAKAYLIEVKKEITFIRLLKYILGMITISFGVVMMLRSNLGVSSWDTLHYSIHMLTGITIGSATIVVALLFTSAVIIMNKNFKYLLMTIPIFAVGGLIDLINLELLVNFEVTTIPFRIITYIIGLLSLPLGGSLLIISTYPAGVFDEFMLVVMRKLNTSNLLKVRVIIELIAVLVALILGLIAGIGIGMISIGTLIFSLTVGWFIKTYLKLFERIGIYETKQTN